MSKAAEVEAIGLSPGIGTVRMFRAVKGIAGILQGFASAIGSGACVEQGLGQGQTEIDGEFPKGASIRQEDAGFGFGNGLGIISQMPVEIAGRVEAAKLELDGSGAVGEGAGLLQVLTGQGGIVRKEKPDKEGAAATKIGVNVVR